jgi:exodeoxyribonuclease VII small subunit
MSANKDLNAEVAKLSYEEARDELIKVVAELEQGSVSLEASLALWERGEALANQCETWLTGARKRLDDAIETKKAKS